jgi:hypothetical protein
LGQESKLLYKYVSGDKPQKPKSNKKNIDSSI